LLQLDGIFGFAGWRWLYFVEGVPAILLGLVVLKYLPDTPRDAKWLSAAQSEWLTRTIASESAQAPGGQTADWRHAFTDSKVWLLSAFWLLQAFGTIGVTLFLPQILKGLSGATNFQVSLLSALPFLLACVLMYFNGRHSDAQQERRLHLGLPLLISGALLAISIYAGNLTATYVMLLVAVALNWAVTPVFWAVTTEYLKGGAVAAGAIALINAVANFAGVGLPPVMGYIKDQTGSYDYGLLVVAGALLLGGVLGLSLQRRCSGPPMVGAAA
jgi:predicted MFS family arabinose efflux permease